MNSIIFIRLLNSYLFWIRINLKTNLCINRLFFCEQIIELIKRWGNKSQLFWFYVGLALFSLRISYDVLRLGFSAFTYVSG